VTGKQVMKADNVPEVLAVMATAGLYDDSGKWLYHTGLPAKSGVGGGIIAVSPGKFGHRGDLASARQGRQQRARPEGDRRHLEPRMGGNP
jgi:glutaminase